VLIYYYNFLDSNEIIDTITSSKKEIKKEKKKLNPIHKEMIEKAIKQKQKDDQDKKEFDLLYTNAQSLYENEQLNRFLDILLTNVSINYKLMIQFPIQLQAIIIGKHKIKTIQRQTKTLFRISPLRTKNL